MMGRAGEVQWKPPPVSNGFGFLVVYDSPADHNELKRTLRTSNFVFYFRTHVPNNLIPVNPLGLTIKHFRQDEAFN